MTVNPQAETERVCCQIPKYLVDQMKEMAEHQQATYAEFYKQCMLTGFWQVAEGYNKVLVNKKLRLQ